MKCALSLVLAAVAAFGSVSVALGAPARQAALCPVAADDLVSGVVGAPAHILDPTFGVTQDGADTECLFSAGGSMVLVKRSRDFFPAGSGATATPEQVDQLRLLSVDEVD